MRCTICFAALSLAVAAVLGASTLRDSRVEFSEAERSLIASMILSEAIAASPTNRYADDPHAVALGRMLFFEPRLSRNHEVSCASCHDPNNGWTDGRALAVGLAEGKRNTPSLWNVNRQRWATWDGRADSLWAQALGPIEHAEEMGSTRVAVFRLLAEDGALRRAYQAAFGELPRLTTQPLPEHAAPRADADHPDQRAWSALPAGDRRRVNEVFANIGKALEGFERGIVSRDSPFDRFAADLRDGEIAATPALSASAQRGLKLFIGKANCTLCHTGSTFTDHEFHNIGLAESPRVGLDVGRHAGVPPVKSSPFNGLGAHSDDRRRSANRKIRFVTQKLNNLGEFKTPSLRGVAKTAPYMHDGRFATLEEVVRFYSTLDQEPPVGHREESLQPLRLTDREVNDLVAFLRSLTGAPDDPALTTRPRAIDASRVTEETASVAKKLRPGN